MAKELLVQGLCVLASARQPRDDGGLTIAEDAFGRRWVQPFSQRREDQGDLARRGFQSVQRRVASSREGGAASLTAEGLDPLSLPMLAIPNEGVDVSLGIPEVQALLVGTGIPLGVDSLGCATAAFYLTPRTHGCRRWPST